MPKVRLGAKSPGFTTDPVGFGWRGFCVLLETQTAVKNCEYFTLNLVEIVRK